MSEVAGMGIGSKIHHRAVHDVMAAVHMTSALKPDWRKRSATATATSGPMGSIKRFIASLGGMCMMSGAWTANGGAQVPTSYATSGYRLKATTEGSF